MAELFRGFTRPDGKLVYIRFADIVSFTDTVVGEAGKTHLRLSNGNELNVMETVDKIIKAIKDG